MKGKTSLGSSIYDCVKFGADLLSAILVNILILYKIFIKQCLIGMNQS